MDMNLGEQYDCIYRYCYLKLHNAQQAEDVTQETFLRFLESGSYREMGKPLAYLYTIAGNLCVDEYRKKRPQPLTWDEPASAGFEEETAERVALGAAMETLSENERELLLLRYVNGLSFADLSKMYGRSRFALSRELSKITRRLERRMADEI